MEKTFSPSYSSSQITYVEAEAIGFSRFRFRFHRKRTAFTASASSFRFRFRFHIPDRCDCIFGDYDFTQWCRRMMLVIVFGQTFLFHLSVMLEADPSY